VDNEHNALVEMAFYPTQQLLSAALGNQPLVSPTSNVPLVSSVITNSVNLFATVMETVFQTSSVSRMYVKKFVVKMETVTRMKFVKEFNVSKAAGEIVIVPREKLAKTTNVLILAQRAIVALTQFACHKITKHSVQVHPD